VLILPSKREGFGIIAIEANACGVPVITLNNDMNAAKDLIFENNGWIINDDSTELANIINNIIENGIDSYKRNICREHAKKYDWNHITTQTGKYYLDILK
jgi:glycosyltransferase involved in cell wall biosynthesis